jgi:hypothetical protein
MALSLTWPESIQHNRNSGIGQPVGRPRGVGTVTWITADMNSQNKQLRELISQLIEF